MKEINIVTASELLLDERFMSWHRQEEEAGAPDWDRWIADSAEHRAMADRAILVLDGLRRLRDRRVPDRVRESCWQRIMEKMKEDHGENGRPVAHP